MNSNDEVFTQGSSSPDLPPADPKASDLSSDEYPETQVMRVGIFFKGRKQVNFSGLDDSGDMSRQGVLGGSGAFLSSVPRALAATIQRQFVGELDVSSNKSSTKKMSCGRRGGRLSHLPRATSRKKAPQEKKSLGSSVSKLVLGRKSQPCFSEGPLAPAALPPISGPPVLGRAEKYSLVTLGSKEPKHNTEKKPSVSRTRGSKLVAEEDTNPNEEPAPTGQLPANRPEPSHLSVYHGDYNSGDPKIKTSQVPGNSQILAMAQGGVKPRVSPPSGDQEPLVHPPQEERKQSVPRAQCCPQCPVLQREIDNLKEQLAAMQRLIDRFQIL
ncbi:uncharacterized protein CXorf49 homolog isoform X2 [Rousettus aegyptiacus]|uniref:uncharacterized protein CXorf49 homolog isoform X2 n=1 Tax=Rousettus aegyptiacus TaxID=9407 RepID=UPI00168D28AC|nr:uncharacterized protein CXorf49 homolog isoform X2 [Rousettus aegyptiacus]